MGIAKLAIVTQLIFAFLGVELWAGHVEYEIKRSGKLRKV